MVSRKFVSGVFCRVGQYLVISWKSIVMDIDWKDKLGAAFGIDPADVAENEPIEEPNAVEQRAATGRLDVMLDKRNRNGKKVTLVVGFDGSDEAVKALAKELKLHCGVGGSARGGEILIQGDMRQRVCDFLLERGYKARII